MLSYYYLQRYMCCFFRKQTTAHAKTSDNILDNRMSHLGVSDLHWP